MLYGYKKDKETGRLIIIEKEAINVRNLFHMYAINNFSIAKIAKIFNSKSILTSQNKKWTVSTLSRMLKNPKYKGFYCGNKSEVTDYISKKIKQLKKEQWIMYEDNKKIPPIIDKNLWDKANKRLESRNLKFGKDYSKEKTIYQNRYPFSAKIYCETHNKIFHRRKNIKSNNDISWFCSTYLQEGKKACNSPNIRQSELYIIFDEILKKINFNIKNISKILTNLYNNTINVNFEKEIIELKNKINKINKKKEKLLDLCINGNLNNDEFNKKNNELNNDIIKLKENINILKEDKKINSIEIKNKIIDLLLNKIIVSKTNENNIKLNIYLKSNKGKNITLNFTFKRGYNTTSTKRYMVKYSTIIYI